MDILALSQLIGKWWLPFNDVVSYQRRLVSSSYSVQAREWHCQSANKGELAQRFRTFPRNLYSVSVWTRRMNAADGRMPKDYYPKRTAYDIGLPIYSVFRAGVASFTPVLGRRFNMIDNNGTWQRTLYKFKSTRKSLELNYSQKDWTSNNLKLTKYIEKK